MPRLPILRPPVPRRGEVWLIALDPTVGHEIRKTRPAVIVTSDIYNQVIVRPPDGGLAKSSVTLPDQLRAVDRSRLVRRLGRLRPETLRQLDRSLRIVLDLL